MDFQLTQSVPLRIGKALVLSPIAAGSSTVSPKPSFLVGYGSSINKIQDIVFKEPRTKSGLGLLGIRA